MYFYKEFSLDMLYTYQETLKSETLYKKHIGTSYFAIHLRTLITVSLQEHIKKLNKQVLHKTFSII